MGDAMVTARMPQEKKDAGMRVLARLGTNASQAVNALFDYLIEHGELPFAGKGERRTYTEEEVSAACAWVDSLPMQGASQSPLGGMALSEARRERLASEGLLEGGEQA